MNHSQLTRLGGAAGIIFAIVFVIGFLISGDPPGFNDSAEQFVTYFSDNRGELQVTMALLVIAGPAFLLFLSVLVGALRGGEGRNPATLSGAAYGGGLIFATLIFVAVACAWGATYHGGLDGNVLRLIWDVSNGSFLFAFGIGIATMVGAAGAAGLATGALGRWLSVFAAVLGAYCLVVAIIASFSETGAFNPNNGALPAIAVLAFLVWVMWTSIVLIARTPGEPAESTG